MKNWIISDRSALLGILLFICVYFARLFTPAAQLIVTPDFGRSDAWHFSYPTKFALSESLRNNSLPVWRSDMGDGFPVFAEGQTGALFLPNLILFKILPPVTAYNAAHVFALLTLAIGMYALARTLGLGPASSVFAAITVSFSGLSVTNLTHIALLQGMSLIPAIITLSILTVRRRARPWGALLSLILTQQIFAGFPQSVLLAGLIASVFVLYELYRSRSLTQGVGWIFWIVLGLIGGAAQLLPSYEFLQQITDPGGFSQSNATAYSMPIAHITSFFLPFPFGNPKLGTYPPFYRFDGSIFWENTAYIGIIPAVLFVASLSFVKKNPLISFLWLVASASVILATGKYSPAYVLFSFWPLNLFRVPSRFLWLSVIAVTLASGVALDRLHNRLRIPLVIVHGFLIASAFFTYHLLEPADVWTSKPDLANEIAGRTVTIGEGKTYNDVMTGKGWTDPLPYRFLKNGLSQNSNILWGISNHYAYAGRQLQRPGIVNSLLSETIQLGESAATISATKFLDMSSVTDILSYRPVDGDAIEYVSERTDGTRTIYHYRNPGALPRARFVYDARTAATVREAVTTLRSADFDPETSALLEAHQNAPVRFSGSAQNRISWTRNTHTEIGLQVFTEKPGLLILADTYYPGWEAAVDGITTPIYATNLTQRGIFVPSGTHAVTFVFRPASVARGIRISATVMILTVILGAVPPVAAAVRTRKKARRRALRP